MAINFDTALGIHEQALLIRKRRTEVLSSNVANADTPNYKAQDIDFRAALKNAGVPAVQLEATQQGHITTNRSIANDHLQFRVPDQPSLDGNTVDMQLEKAAVAENNVRYQATLSFLTRRFSGMVNAFKGE